MKTVFNYLLLRNFSLVLHIGNEETLKKTPSEKVVFFCTVSLCQIVCSYQ